MSHLIFNPVHKPAQNESQSQESPLRMSSNKSPKSKPAFSFANLLSPKTSAQIKFNEQPKQSGIPPTPKRSGLEAYARKTRDPLPEGFAEHLLECEMQFALDEISIETVNKLTELYSIGMVYYEPETIDKYKYQYFAGKLQDLMLKPSVKEAMLKSMSSNSTTKTAEEDKELRRMRLENQLSRVDSEKEAFTLVKSHEHKEKEITRVLEGDLGGQKDRMKKRLAERKARSQSRAQSVTYSEDNSSTTEEAIQELEKELEGLPAINKRDLQDIKEEEEESRYATPPRRRSKNGVMIFYQKGRKSVKPTEPMTERGYNRRQSFNVEQVTTAIVARVGRASSFGNKTGPPGLDVLKRLDTAPVELKKKQEVVQEQKETDSSSSDNENLSLTDLNAVTKTTAAEVNEIVEPVAVDAQTAVDVQPVNNETVEEESNKASETVTNEEAPEQKVAEDVTEEQVQDDNKVTDAPAEVVVVAQSENVPEPVELEVSPEKDETQQAEEPVETQQETVESKQEETQAEPVAEESQSEQVEAPKVEEQTQEVEQKEETEATVTKARRESEAADEARLAALKVIDEEQKVLLEEFVQKQEAQKEEVKSKTEAKYKQKREAMEEDMEEDEKGGMMWQKVLAKMEKDQEDEIQKALEKLSGEQSEELEKYKKKLQQQKMFKLAELSD